MLLSFRCSFHEAVLSILYYFRNFVWLAREGGVFWECSYLAFFPCFSRENSIAQPYCFFEYSIFFISTYKAPVALILSSSCLIAFAHRAKSPPNLLHHCLHSNLLQSQLFHFSHPPSSSSFNYNQMEIFNFIFSTATFHSRSLYSLPFSLK